MPAQFPITNVRIDGQFQAQTEYRPIRLGTQYPVDVDIIDPDTGNGVDLTGWTFTAEATFLRYDLAPTSTSINFTNQQADSESSETLTIAALDQTDVLNHGRVILQIPGDMYGGTPAAVNSNTDVPVAVIQVTVTKPAKAPEEPIDTIFKKFLMCPIRYAN